MSKYYTKEQVILKFKAEVLAILKIEYPLEYHGMTEEAWSMYLDILYDLKKISLSQKKIWVFPKSLIN